MMKNIQIIFISLCVVILLAPENTKAQKRAYTFHLKNGSEITGIILSRTQDSLKLKTKCRNIIIFACSEIDSLKQSTLEISPRQKRKRNKKKFRSEFNKDVFKKGLYSYSTLGLLTTKLRLDENACFALHSIVGYEFKHWLGTGIGVGLESQIRTIIPIYFNLKTHFANIANSPLINFHVGYSVPLKEKSEDDIYDYNFEGGLNWGLDLGIASFKTENYAFVLSAGYHYQRIRETCLPHRYTWHETKKITTYSFNKIVIKIGFLFR